MQMQKNKQIPFGNYRQKNKSEGEVVACYLAWLIVSLWRLSGGRPG